MSNLFTIAAQASTPIPPSTLNPAIPVPRPRPQELQSNLILDEVETLASEVPIGDDDEIVDLEETIMVDVE